jgi:hypothetical protein
MLVLGCLLRARHRFSGFILFTRKIIPIDFYYRRDVEIHQKCESSKIPSLDARGFGHFFYFRNLYESFQSLLFFKD